MQYVFFNDKGPDPDPDNPTNSLSLALDGVQANIIANGGNTTVTAPFLLHGIKLLQSGEVFKKDIKTIVKNDDILRKEDIDSPPQELRDFFNFEIGQGSIFKPATHFEILQAGFSSSGDGDDQIITRAPDHFLLVEVRPGRIDPDDPEKKPKLDQDRLERFLFATGNIDSRLKEGFKQKFSVDRFFLSAGLENFGQKGVPDDKGQLPTIAERIRAFMRAETGLDPDLPHLSLKDTGLLVVNAGPNNANAHNALLHADFGLKGTGSEQKSTISVTIGGVEYTTKEPIEALVTGKTIGSSRITASEASVAVSSPLTSTAAGGGNPALKNPDDSLREGYAGYFVLENFDPDPTSHLKGGSERPLGGSDTQYAYLRLATAIGEEPFGSRSALSLHGWAAGLAEFQSNGAIGVRHIDTDDTAENFRVWTNQDTNRVEVQVKFSQYPNLITLGGLNGVATLGASAFVDDQRFAARTTDASTEVALITGELVKAGLPPEIQTLIPDYQYVKWGFFFGDTNTTPGAREHVHLGTWVAGKIADPGSFPQVGSATYTGHAIGNVYTNGSLYTAVGTYENSWDFGTRSGTVNIKKFDGVDYTGTTQLRNNSVHFNGDLSATDRTGGLQGNFVQGGGDHAAGVIGRFSLQETTGKPTYRASGTFAAEKKK